MGLISISLAAVQWILSFIAFQYPTLSSQTRSKSMPYHRYCGAMLLVLYAATVVLGITEKAIFSGEYSAKKQVTHLANISGIAVIAITIFTVSWIIQKSVPAKALKT
ncbi:hypothetical protein ACOME3_006659 [Neoechinorhynchus agilis]